MIDNSKETVQSEYDEEFAVDKKSFCRTKFTRWETFFRQ